MSILFRLFHLLKCCLPGLKIKVHSRYAGPLLLMMRKLCVLQTIYRNRKRKTVSLSMTSLRRHYGRKIVYFDYRPSPSYLKFITGWRNAFACSLDRTWLVITNEINPVVLTRGRKAAFLYSEAVSAMNKVCSNVDFMIHHCGSGTYSYQLTGPGAAILLGSRLYPSTG